MTVLAEFSGGPWPEADPLHHHPHQQSTYVASGEVLFLSEQGEFVLKAGDTIVFEPNERHAIKLLSIKARLIDTFTPLREDFL